MNIITLAALFTASAIAAVIGSPIHMTRDAVKSLLIVSVNTDGSKGVVVAPLSEIAGLKIRGTDIASVELITGPGVDAGDVSCQPLWFLETGVTATGPKFVRNYPGSLVNIFNDGIASSDHPKVVKVELKCDFS